MQFVQLTTQIVRFSSGNKAFFKHVFYFLCHSFGAKIEYKIYSYWTLSNHSQRPLTSFWINNDNIYLQYSKAISACNHKYIQHECMCAHHEVTMLTLELVWHLQWELLSGFFFPFKVQKHGQKEELPTNDSLEACTLLYLDSLFEEVPNTDMKTRKNSEATFPPSCLSRPEWGSWFHCKILRVRPLHLLFLLS